MIEPRQQAVSRLFSFARILNTRIVLALSAASLAASVSAPAKALTTDEVAQAAPSQASSQQAYLEPAQTAAFRPFDMHSLGTTLSKAFSGMSLQFPFVPDPSFTVGSLCNSNDPDYETQRYSEQIPYCTRNVSSQDRARIYDHYGVPKNCRGEYTIDHFVPLSLGGSNHDDNLWPENKQIKALRQNLEMQMYIGIRDGRVTQSAAVQRVVYEKLHPPVSNPADFSFCQ